jgi:beta-N-acetylhexosaminidase
MIHGQGKEKGPRYEDRGTRNRVHSREIREKIAQMIMVGFREAEIDENTPIARTIKDHGLGGVILYNIDLKSFLEAQKNKPDLDRVEAAKLCPKNILSGGQLKTLTSALKSYSKKPLLISVDQEGGMVSRLGPAAGFAERLSPRALGEKDTLQATMTEAEAIAQDLWETGINLNLAPVVDLNLNPESLIARMGRSFGSDPDLVYRHARVFIQAHRERGVLTTLKHFPGKGSAGKDTHFDLADVTSQHQDQELLPFSRLIGEGLADLVMTAHINHREWDDRYPATLSPRVLGGMLRERMGYRGVIISDDLLMGGIVKQFSLEEACVLAVQAGVDILLASNNSPEGDDADLFNRVFESLVKAVEQGRISTNRIELSHTRLMALKQKLGLKGFSP